MRIPYGIAICNADEQFYVMLLGFLQNGYIIFLLGFVHVVNLCL